MALLSPAINRSLQRGAFKTQNTGHSHSCGTQRQTLTGSGRTEGAAFESRGNSSRSSYITATSRQETMLQATFKLCAGSSYRHVRNMKGELPGEEGACGGDRDSQAPGLVGKTLEGGQATQVPIPAVPPIGQVLSLLDLTFPTGRTGLEIKMPLSLVGSVTSGLPSRTPIFLELFLT